MSQAGSRSGCLPTGQREPDPDHTPPRSAGQPLKWTVTHDRRTRRGNAFWKKKKSTGLRRHPGKLPRLFRNEGVFLFAKGESPWCYWNTLGEHEVTAGTEGNLCCSRQRRRQRSQTVKRRDWFRYKYFRVWTYNRQITYKRSAWPFIFFFCRFVFTSDFWKSTTTLFCWPPSPLRWQPSTHTRSGFHKRPRHHSFSTWVFPAGTLTFHWVVKWPAHFRWMTSNNKLTVLRLRRDTQSLFSTLNPCIKRWYE